MKDINKTLQEKYNEEVLNENKKMAKFLKRRRLELGLTLEHVSDGICSTSYLSKIENCQVEVDDSYFNLLFEKLDLKYETVVEKRKIPIYTTILKAYLENNKEYIKKSTTDLVVDNTYCDTEIELLVVFYNLINENYKECRDGLDKFDKIQNTLLKEELQMLIYLEATYHFKVNEYEKTLDYLIELYQSNINDEILQIAIDDLAQDYCFFVNELNGFYWILRRSHKSNYLKILKRIQVKHDLQELVLKPVENIDQEFDIYKEVLNGEYQDLFDYYYTLNLIKRSRYLDAYNYSKELEYDQEFLALKAIAINRIDDVDISFEFLMKLRDITLIETSPSYKILEYYRLKLEKYSYMQLYTTLKYLVFSKHSNHLDNHIYKESFNELLNVAYELGKYKEIIKLLKNINNRN